MATETQSVMFVKAILLKRHPKAFQEYVKEYFKKKKIFGSEYYFAFLLLHISHDNHGTKGVAPCHNGSVNYFGKHSSEPCEKLSEVIDSLLKSEESGVYEISQSFDDGLGWSHVD